MIFWLTLLIVLLAVLGLVAGLLSIPLEVKIDIDTLARQKARIRLSWLYGWVTFSPQATRPGPATVKPRPVEKKQKPSVTKPRQDGQFLLAMLQSDGFVRRIVKLVIDCIRVVEFRESRLYCRLGLGDPADTGQCLGLVAPLFVLLQQRLVPTAQLEPEFNEATLILRAGTRLRVIPLRYLLLLLQFFFSVELWRGVRSGLRAGKA